MAAATGFTELHVAHQISFAAGAGGKEPAVTIAAFISGIEMKRVAEKRIGLKFDVFYHVAFRATTGYTERGLPFMAGAARQAPLHLLHGDMRVGAVRLEYFFMTIRAAEEFKMKFVAEDNSAEIGYFNRDFSGQMAGAALGESKRLNLVMTLTA